MAAFEIHSKPIVASSSDPFVLRRAIDPFGRPGSLYDGWRDQILNHSRINLSTQSMVKKEPVTCFVKNLNLDGPPNLLECINMNNQLRVSIALQMIPTMGIGALINYSRPIDKYTRVLCYSCYSRTEYLPDNEFTSLQRSTSSISNTLATHLIVMVNWGIDSAIVLQLPPDDNLVKALEYVIEKVCIPLRDNLTNPILSQDDINFLEKIVHTEVFSNIPDLCKINSIIDFHHDISRIKNDINRHKPYNYHLYPIQKFYNVNISKQNIFKELPEEQIKRVEHYLLNLSSEMKRLTKMLDQDYPNLQRYLRDQLYKMRTQWSTLRRMYTGQIEHLQELIVRVRREEKSQNMINQDLKSDEAQNLAKAITDLSVNVIVMQKKEHLLKDLSEKQFQYRNASEYDIKHNDDDEAIEHKLLTDVKHERIVCFDDNLYKNDKSQWHTIHGQLIKERNENSQLQVIYVDFSYSSHQLNRMIVLPLIKKKNSPDVTKPLTPSPLQHSRKYNSINILLLGESGAGKSTFINAFANYLTFEKLGHARKKPVVLIPVSFVMTLGNDFEERQVTFGGMDTLSNEVHDHSSQSVTQHCKSYVFTLSDADTRGRKLRIIDTPGIGDVRGVAQDDINMQHILSYMTNLTHLDAVCILMKPNNARLNIFFRSCLVQLFDLLGENARDNIIFCFTNARATFYTPGNTGPLLKQLLKSLPVEDIPFAKMNTFCFDSESFRYLVAKQNGIEFSDSEEKDYNDSWEKSSTESKRFLEHIRTHITTSLLFSERKSIKDVQLKISLLTRPILEAMRNVLRNIALCNTESPKVSIKLCPRIVKCTTAICLACPREFLQCGDFWITADELHVFHNKCRTCKCSPNEHYPIDYQLEYELCRPLASNSDSDLTKKLDDLCQKSAEFAHFLVGATDISQNDLFLTGFERMIKEEDNICRSNTSSQVNLNLLKCLKELKVKYEEIRKKLLDRKKHIELSEVYEKIQQLNSDSTIKSQMTAVEEWRSFMIRYYEYEVRN